jgi:anthranilate/para-aminobenzoate synthase component II
MSIKQQLEDKIEERERVIHGKTHITEEEEKAYNNLGKEILELRRALYPKKR